MGDTAPRIVVLDGHTLVPSGGKEAGRGRAGSVGAVVGGDTDGPAWSALEAMGRLTVYERTAEDRITARVGDAPVVLTNKTPLSGATLAQLPGVRYIGVLATGVDGVDLAAADGRGITVTHVPDYSSDSVAQHVFALILELTNHTWAHHQAVREGGWARCEDFCFWVEPVRELAGRSLGVVGMGRIGRRVARIGAAMGMRVLAAHRQSGAADSRGGVPGVSGVPGVPGVPVEWLPFDDLLSVVDVLTLHCPLNDRTRHMIGREQLAAMKPTAILINTARGGVVDGAALADALVAGRLAGAGLDVLEHEPPTGGNPLIGAPGCLITPHIAWAGTASRRRLMAQAAKNLEAYLRGTPINVVNPSRCRDKTR